MTFFLPPSMTFDQMELYALQFRCDESKSNINIVTEKLKSGQVVPGERDRSPSPEPVFAAGGKRVNTRDVRYRLKLESERCRIIESAMKKFSGQFKPPADLRTGLKVQKKLYLPAKQFPQINFIGLLIGPRGKTLKKLESDTQTTISIRGKGSVKVGKVRDRKEPGDEDELHCLISGEGNDKVDKAIEIVQNIVKDATANPEGENDLKREQLRELARLNGTLRDDESLICQNCGAYGHRRWECPEAVNFTQLLVCKICGNSGHSANDCTLKNNPEALYHAQQRNVKLDTEYAHLMAELGETPPSAQNSNNDETQPQSAKTYQYPPGFFPPNQ